MPEGAITPGIGARKSGFGICNRGSILKKPENMNVLLGSGF